MRGFNIDFQKELNPDQLAAVCAPYDRPALVLAGAGSGKTRTLTYRVAWFLAECGFYPREILLLTFTNKAAHQMLERISGITSYSSSEFWGGTFHSMGNRFLRIDGREIGVQPDFVILDTDDSDAFLKRCVEEEYPKFFGVKDNPRVKLLREIISYARNTCQSVEDAMMDRFSWIETPCSQIADIAKFYDFDKRRKNYCDFDDLLELWKKLLQESPKTLQKYVSRYGNILVDEYQDTNLLQSSILDLLASRGNISAVGDDAQCIYSWRGAEIENILHFKDRYPAAGIYKIEKNYRSSTQILDFANSILKNMPSTDEYRKTLVPAREGKAKPLVIRAMDAISQGKQVADCIRDVVEGGKYDYSDIAVLYRSHFQAMDLQLQMQYKNIPFIMTSGLKFFEQAHVKDLVSMIKFAANQKDFIALLRLLRFLPKVGEKTAEKIFDFLSTLSQKRAITPIEAMGDKSVQAKLPSSARESFNDLAADLMMLDKMFKIAREQAPASAIEPQEDFSETYSDFSSSDSENSQFGKPSEEGGAFSKKLIQGDFFDDVFSQDSSENDKNNQSEKSSDSSKSVALSAASADEVLGKSSPKNSAQVQSGESEQDASSKKSAKNKRTPFVIPERPQPKDFVKAACIGWYCDVMKTSYSDWEDRVSDFDALFEYAARYTKLDEFLDNVTLEIGEHPQAVSADGANAANVRLMTVHQAKGLEFPVVFVIGAADGLFPTKRSIDDGDVDEERRLFYVAATRAMDYLVVTYPRVNVSRGDYEMRPPSRFLEDIDPSLYDTSY